MTQRNEWIELLLDKNGKTTLADLCDASERRYEVLDQLKPHVFFLYVDRGEELYVRGEERQHQRFSQLLAQAVADPRIVALMSMRSDFLGALQNDEWLFAVHRKIDVPPLREAELSRVISEPARQLSARFESAGLVDVIARRTLEDSARDVGALPLLSYTLDDMWTHMVRRGDGVLRLSAGAFNLDGVLAERANAFLASHPKSEGALRRLLTLKLANIGEDGKPTQRRALRSEFSNQEWRLASELADHPNRLLVTVTSEGGEAYTEVAHEAIFRRWDKLREWIDAEREFLAWRSGLEATRRAWQLVPGSSKNEALLMGLPLAQASIWLAKRPADISLSDREFITLSRKAMARRRLRVQAAVSMLFAAISLVIAAWLGERWLNEQIFWVTRVRGQVLTAVRERALKPKDVFKECTDCPEMVVVPTGSFLMGSLDGEGGDGEHPQRQVTIAKPFAVARFELTFHEWDACAKLGDCDARVSDSEWGRERQPVINVSWADAQRYVAWLSHISRQDYRLLSEAEWEYAARAGKQTNYSWNDLIGTGNANCDGCNSKWDGRQPAPVGSFAPNAFGLHDMHGNVWEWVKDCYNYGYPSAPTDGSAWITSNCSTRVARGGSWTEVPRFVRSAVRNGYSSDFRDSNIGFRVGRTLKP